MSRCKVKNRKHKVTGWVTINTDASFCHKTKVGAFAYWIKSDSLFLRGRASFRDLCADPHDAEQKALINALHILKKQKPDSLRTIRKVIFNRDNKGTGVHNEFNPAHKMLENMLWALHQEIQSLGGDILKFEHFFEFRHVRAHTHTKTARYWVNDWLDQQAKIAMRARRSELLRLQGEPDTKTSP